MERLGRRPVLPARVRVEVSRNPYRLSFRRKGAMEITWHHEFQPPPMYSNLMVDLARVPGIRHEPGWSMIEIPENCWNLRNVGTLIDALHVDGVFARRAPRYALGLDADIATLREPYPWQRTGINFALANGQGLVLCDAMGLGKTFTAICAAEIAAHAINPNKPRLIIAPAFTRDVWLRELLASGVIEDESEFCALQTRDFNDVSWAGDASWFFCHYDIIHAWYSRIVSSRRGKPVVAIVDEFHRVKNSKTQRAKGTHNAVAGAQFKMLLSGTPIDNAVGELWNPLTILHGSYSWGSPTEFRRRYAGALRGQFGMQDGMPSNIEELRHRMEPYYLRRTIEDTGSALPPLRRERLSVEMNATDLRAHHDIASVGDVREMVDAILEGRSSTAAFEILNKLRKLTSHAKLKTTIDFVANLREQGESVVVFCWQRETAKKISFASNYVAVDEARWGQNLYISGEMSQNDRDNLVHQFQKTGGLLVATYGALAEGVTLTRARAIVLHDLDWKMSTILQAEARIHRLGQQRGCMSTWMIAEDSIDVILARALLRKAEVIEQTLGIDAPAKAVDELELSTVAGYTEMEAWARDVLERWVS